MALPEVGPADRGLIIPSGCILVLHVLPTAFFVFAPVLVLPAVGHCGTFQRQGRSKPLVGDYGFSEVGFSEVGLSEVGFSEVGSSEVGI